MSTVNDTLVGSVAPDRVHYAIGVLLDHRDFVDEQNYHRSRLARALAYLHGSGTVAGLRVGLQPPVEPTAESLTGRDEQLMVSPGLAIDRLGRLIEVPRAACIRLNRWYESQNADDLIEAVRPPPYTGVNVEGVPETGILVEDNPVDIIVVDVFLRFEVCERGKTPAFATGPFDALDAVVPSRLRDAYELNLVIRAGPEPPLPVNNWPDLSGIADPAVRRRAVQDTVLGAWPKDDSNPSNPEPLAEYAPEQDLTAVFLARVIIPVLGGGPPGSRPVRQEAPVVVDNYGRLFAYTPRALATIEGL